LRDHVIEANVEQVILAGPIGRREVIVDLGDWPRFHSSSGTVAVRLLALRDTLRRRRLRGMSVPEVGITPGVSSTE
jgi:hypothetical protein